MSEMREEEKNNYEPAIEIRKQPTKTNWKEGI